MELSWNVIVVVFHPVEVDFGKKNLTPTHHHGKGTPRTAMIQRP
jgi:hypothetical protein